AGVSESDNVGAALTALVAASMVKAARNRCGLSVRARSEAIDMNAPFRDQKNIGQKQPQNSRSGRAANQSVVQGPVIAPARGRHKPGATRRGTGMRQGCDSPEAPLHRSLAEHFLRRNHFSRCVWRVATAIGINL